MEVIYGLIPGMILMGLVGVGVFFWAAKSGQFDDMQGEAHRILMDDDLEDDAPAAESDEQATSAALDSGADSSGADASQVKH